MRIYRKFLTAAKYADSYIKVEDSYGSVSLKLADCSENVFIEFSHDSSKRAKISLKKLEVIEEGVKLIRNRLEKAVEDG